MGYILGLDLGITSVGFGIIEEETYNVIKYGVRLFEEGTADNNFTRRTMRSTRRLKERRNNRINAIKYLLLNNGIIDSLNYPMLENVYELRVKGLSQKLTSIELANVLVNIAKRRGSSLEVAVDEDNKDDAASASALTRNTAELINSGLFICQYQLAKINNGEKIRSHDNIYRTCDYVKELKQILSNQNLSEEINGKIVEIITRRRNFAEGPGSEKFPTPYGSYRQSYTDGKYSVVHVNLIDEMRGKCSIFKDEPRIAKSTYKACLFNLLNDLNNIRIDKTICITTAQKNEIINKYVNPKGKFSFADLVKFLNVKKEQISGYRIDKSGKPLLSTFDIYAKLIKILPEGFVQNKDVVDEIIDILTRTLVVDERISIFTEMNLGLTNEQMAMLANITKVNGYHSLSEKAMDILIPELIDTNKNQMQIITENNLGKSKEEVNGADILFDESAILSPVAKRVHIQALKVVNELRKEYGEFSSIVIETTRAKNSKEEKEQIKELQKRQEESKKRSEQLLLEMEKDPSKFNTITKLKLVLYKQQDGKTIYAGLPIDLDRLLSDPTAYQIEHIIPYGVSFDNSLNNKSLASAKENQDKGRRTPWAYFATGKVAECNGLFKTWEQYEGFVNSLTISRKKKENLLNQNDITKFDNMQEFAARNLNDTSYGIRTVMNTMKDYYKANSIPTIVFTVKGKLTHDFRSRVGLKKDRDFYIHHAIDALIIAGSKNQKVFNNAYSLLTATDGKTIIKETGELFDYSQDPFEDSRFLQFISSLKNIEGKPEDFSYKVDRKTNRQFSDQTIYSTRNVDGTDYIVEKYKDIYGPDGEKLKKLFVENKAKDMLLMAKNDVKTFDFFVKVYESYKNETNPFAKFKEENGPIKKYSKNGDGPVIYQVKYYSSKLGNCLDVSHKYPISTKKKVVLLSNSPYRTDIYQSPEGIYKMLTVRRYHVKNIDGYNVIEKNVYDGLLNMKKITNEDKFLFSLNKNDAVCLVTKNDINENEKLEDTKQLYRFIGTNNDVKNVIELKRINSVTEKRLTYTIGKSVIKLEKYSVTPAGKWYKINKELLKLKWK